ncbi:MAG: Acyl-CoA thioester hydrolase YbgC [Pseudomonadota bacterium]|jgi:acyl-CoA thioester hydrolase
MTGGVAGFVWQLRVQFNETDGMGVVHHKNYIAYVEQARVEYLRARGLSYKEVTAAGFNLAVIDLRFRYLKPARFDDLLDVSVAVQRLGRASADFVFQIHRGADKLCEGYTKLACVNRDGVPTALPASVHQRLGGAP